MFELIGSRLDAVIHFASIRDVVEDLATVEYLQDLARQAGLRTQYIAMEDIGATRDGRYTDLNNQVIEAIFKLYPWEIMFAEEFSRFLPGARVVWFEPPWKAILSNKAALALLWELHPNHPNLLPAYIDTRRRTNCRTAGCASRSSPAKAPMSSWRPWTDSGCGARPLRTGPVRPPGLSSAARVRLGTLARSAAGSSRDQAAGIGIREDDSLITRDTARFVPHAIVD